jgi:hypothetical protein
VPYSRNSIRIDLGEGHSLYVVRENGNPEVIVSIVQPITKKLSERLKLSLTVPQAMRLSRALASVATLDGPLRLPGVTPVPELDPDEEDTDPAIKKPG